MDELMENGGLTTDGMEVDPISGNEIPTGSNASDVRDDVDAKLSDGEYVIPADVVKYFGVSYFEKLRKKAKEGMEEMDQEGRVGGDDPDEMMDMEDEYAEGGMVEGQDVDGLVNRVKAAAAKDPSVSNMLKAKGIFVQEPQPMDQMQQNTMQAGGVPPKALPPKVAGKDNASGYAEGGIVGAQAPNFTSAFDPYAHTPGFSQPNTGAPAGTASVGKPVCPEGYSWDAGKNMCVPNAPAAAVPASGGTDRSRGSDGGGYAGGAGTSAVANPNAWMDKYDYTNPETLYEQTMTTLGAGTEEGAPGISTAEGQAGSGGGFLEGAGALLSKGLAGGIIGKFMNTTNAARSAANAIVLRDMGRDDLADKIDEQYGTFVKEKGLENVPESWRKGTGLAESIRESGRVKIGETAPAAAPTAGTPSSPSTSRSRGLASRDTSTRGASDNNQSWRGEKSAAGDAYTEAGKAGTLESSTQGGVKYKSTPGGGTSQAQGSTAPTSSPRPKTRDDVKKETTEQKLSRGGGFAKGGLVKRPNKNKK